MTANPLTLSLPAGGTVAALFDSPQAPQACLVLAHGAGAGMDHPFMAELASRLCRQGIAVLRFQFPFMQQGSRRPDPPAIAQGAVRAAVAEAARRLPDVPLFAGGKSCGQQCAFVGLGHRASSLSCFRLAEGTASPQAPIDDRRMTRSK